MSDHLHVRSQLGARVLIGQQARDSLSPRGVFTAKCYHRGELVWSDEFPNTVVTVGQNLMLNTLMTGSAYTVTGPFMGLISSASFSAVNAADTMSSHAGWLEAGNAHAPTYTAPRQTCVWSAASAGAISLSAALSFSMTGSGTVQGAFICLGSGAVSTIDSTAGTLFSAGTFVTPLPVISGYNLQLNYTLTL